MINNELVKKIYDKVIKNRHKINDLEFRKSSLIVELIRNRDVLRKALLNGNLYATEIYKIVSPDIMLSKFEKSLNKHCSDLKNGIAIYSRIGNKQSPLYTFYRDNLAKINDFAKMGHEEAIYFISKVNYFDKDRKFLDSLKKIENIILEDEKILYDGKHSGMINKLRVNKEVILKNASNHETYRFLKDNSYTLNKNLRIYRKLLHLESVLINDKSIKSMNGTRNNLDYVFFRRNIEFIVNMVMNSLTKEELDELDLVCIRIMKFDFSLKMLKRHRFLKHEFDELDQVINMIEEKDIVLKNNCVI